MRKSPARKWRENELFHKFFEGLAFPKSFSDRFSENKGWRNFDGETAENRQSLFPPASGQRAQAGAENGLPAKAFSMNGATFDGLCCSHWENPMRADCAADRAFEPFKLLACAVINQAVDDLRLFRKAKNKKFAKLQTEFKELLDFFAPGRGMDLLIAGAELALCGEQIRRGLKREGLL